MYFASYREQSKKSRETYSLPNGSTLDALVTPVLENNPNFKCAPERLVAAVNQEYQTHEYILTEGDTVALIPPVSGG